MKARPSSPIFISLEMFMSSLLLFEIVIRMLTQRRKFWRKWCNIIDFLVTVLSLASIMLYFHEESLFEEVEEVAADSILIIRNAVQYMRLIVFLRNQSHNQAPSEDIDFDGMYLESYNDRDEEKEMMLSRSEVETVELDVPPNMLENS